jgi:hypothetical protein
MSDPVSETVPISRLTGSEPASGGRKRGPKFTPEQRELNRARIAELKLKGHSLTEIARGLGMTHWQVLYDLRIVVKRWQDSALANVDEMRGRELAKLDIMEKEAWEAWEKSKGKKRTKTYEAGYAAGEAVPEKQTAREEETFGDPRYFDLLLKCMDRRIKLLGIEAPAKDEDAGVVVRQVVGDSGVGGISDNHQYAALVGFFASLPGAPGAHPRGDVLETDRPQPVGAGQAAPEAGGVLDADYAERR